MKKWLMIFLLLAGTAYGQAQTGFIVGDSVQFSTFEYSYVPHMCMTSGGGVGFLYCVDKTVDSIRVSTTANMGASFSLIAISNTSTTNSPYCGIYAYGDSMFAIAARVAASNNFWIAKFSGASYTRQVFDTVTYTGYSGAGGTVFLGFTLHKDSMLVAHCEETGTTDSFFTILSDGALTQTTTWARHDSAELASPGGDKADFTGNTVSGIAWFHFATQDLLWWGRAGGLDTLNTSFVPNPNAAGNQSGLINIVQVDDDTGLCAFQQTDDAGSDALWSKRFLISGVGSGSGTAPTIDSVQIEPHTSIPTGYRYEPAYSVVGANGDTVYLFYCYWADTTNTDSADIVYKVSTDGGKTWGTRTVYVPAVNTRQRWMVQAPPRIYLRGDYLLRGVMWCDSVATRDTVWAYLDSVAVTGPAAAWLTGVHHSKAGVMPAHSKSYIGTMHRK